MPKGICIWELGKEQIVGMGGKSMCKASPVQDQGQKTHWFTELVTGGLASISNYIVGRKWWAQTWSRSVPYAEGSSRMSYG